jgi:Conserved TM helix
MLVASVDLSESLQQGLDDLIGFLPKLIGFLIILLIGYLIAKALQKVVAFALEKVGTDHALRSGPTGEYVRRVAPDTSPSQVIGRIVFWFILLGALSIAISALGIAALNDFIANVFNYLPNVIAAILILVIAIAIAGLLTQLITRSMGETTMGKLMSTAVPSLVMAIAVFMVLDQLQIATAIVTITYAALLGALALGLALAFGLGGRDLASRMLEDTYQRGREERERYRAERGETVSGRTASYTAPREPPSTGPEPARGA